MGILTSLYTGLSGLSGQSEAMAIYGDNIANSNTIGFKTSRPEFSNIIAKSQGLLGGNQIGGGVHLSAVNPINSQGAILQTESPTDLAITGDGYFVLKGDAGQAFTRNGSFHFDKEGQLITSDNYHVMGLQADENGKITTKLGEIGIKRTVIDGKRTSEVKMNMNLDLRSDLNKVFDPANPDATAHFGTGVTVYDSAGTTHLATVYFNRTDDGVWNWSAMVKGDEIVGAPRDSMVECAKGKLIFDGDGRLKDQITEKSLFNFNKGAKPDQVIKFNFGDDKVHGGQGLNVTQYGSPFEAYRTGQDGYTAGALSGLTFTDDGCLTAVYSNGENVSVAQVALAKVENPEGLFKTGKNRFRESKNSGQPTIGRPQAGGRGRVTSKTLESSTTDVAAELINLMQTQRNFQANSKTVTTSDEMLQEVINLKRN
jgi:flagellar hook protein FlgE